jgi:ketosteroid isomerase-like protein
MAFLILSSCKPLAAQGPSHPDQEEDPIKLNTMNANQQSDKENVIQILSVLDDHEASMADKLALWTDDLVYLAPGQEAIASKETLEAHFEDQNRHGHSEKKHQILELHSYDQIVMVRGQIDGTYYPKGAGRPAQFRNKTLFIFKRQPDQSLKIWRAMYNHEPFISTKG